MGRVRVAVLAVGAVLLLTVAGVLAARSIRDTDPAPTVTATPSAPSLPVRTVAPARAATVTPPPVTRIPPALVPSFKPAPRTTVPPRPRRTPVVTRTAPPGVVTRTPAPRTVTAPVPTPRPDLCDALNLPKLPLICRLTP